MRKFTIIEQDKDWLFDLDGNAFHPKLRDEIEKGMVVGLRITEREIPSNERIKFIDEFKGYIQTHNEFMKLREKEREREEDIRKEIRILIPKFDDELVELTVEKKSLESKVAKLKEKINLNSSQKQQSIDEIKLLGDKLGILNKKIKDSKHHKTMLSQNAIYSPLRNRNYLVDVHNFPKEFFEDNFDYEKFDELEDLFFETATKEKPWEEAIFFSVVKREGDKLWGDVLNKFRRVDSKCPLKEGDRISFYTKSIYLVPSMLNKASKLKPHIQTNFSYKYYRSKQLTDWSGVFLDEKARDFMVPGTYIRFQLKELSTNHKMIYYALILEQDAEYFWGEIQDFYIVIEEKITDPVKTGCIFRFSKKSITEIPLMWNKHLSKLEKFKNRNNMGYTITGYRSDEDYYDLDELK